MESKLTKFTKLASKTAKLIQIKAKIAAKNEDKKRKMS